MIARGILALLVFGLSACVPSVVSAENGIPSQATLQAMGLSGMQQMSDAEGMAIRGRGFLGGRRTSHVYTAGASFAYVVLPEGAVPTNGDLQVDLPGVLNYLPPGAAADLRLVFSHGTFNASSGSSSAVGYIKSYSELQDGNLHITTHSASLWAHGSAWGKAF